MGGGIGMGNTCKPMAVSFQCMTKFTTNKKLKKNKIKTPITHTHTHKKKRCFRQLTFYYREEETHPPKKRRGKIITDGDKFKEENS